MNGLGSDRNIENNLANCPNAHSDYLVEKTGPKKNRENQVDIRTKSATRKKLYPIFNEDENDEADFPKR